MMFQQEDQGTFFVTWESTADTRGRKAWLGSLWIKVCLIEWVTLCQNEVTTDEHI